MSGLRLREAQGEGGKGRAVALAGEQGTAQRGWSGVEGLVTLATAGFTLRTLLKLSCPRRNRL